MLPNVTSLSVFLCVIFSIISSDLCYLFDREVMSHPVATLYTVEKVSTIVHVLKTEQHDGFPVVQKDDENVRSYIVLCCLPFMDYLV